MSSVTNDDRFDDQADFIVRECLDLDRLKSFFLYAGAGSGKTRSLVGAVQHVSQQYGNRLRLSRQRVGVIIYTNAASGEITQRLGFDPLVTVSTIHSFAWSLVDGYNRDIRNWLRTNLQTEIDDLEAEQARGRPNTKASLSRSRLITSKRQRLGFLDEIDRFVYNPGGDNRTRGTLSHTEVISMTAHFLQTKPTLQQILVSQFPILLIDESQDTNGQFMDALLDLEQRFSGKFCLGLFGDTMQRIYTDGKKDLVESIPPSWARPSKRMNHRCPTRVIELINQIRLDDDGQQQVGRSDKPTGYVRLFVTPADVDNKSEIEKQVRQRMAVICNDHRWSNDNDVKTLTLEHHMAARRLGFESLFEPLYAVERFRAPLLEGSLPGITFFTHDIMPLVEALTEGDTFRATSIVRSRSPLFDNTVAGGVQWKHIRSAHDACASLMDLCSQGNPSLLTVLNNIAASNLFPVPESLRPFVHSDEAEDELPGDTGEELNLEIAAWRMALKATIDDVAKYDKYVRGDSQFDTHQGVKGLEFPRVMVVISDDEARGFLFSYEKLFGAKAKSSTDLAHEKAGRETSIDRTRRLFYVACSRAEESLAVLCYSSDPESVAEMATSRNWFEESEVEILR